MVAMLSIFRLISFVGSWTKTHRAIDAAEDASADKTQKSAFGEAMEGEFLRFLGDGRWVRLLNNQKINPKNG